MKQLTQQLKSGNMEIIEVPFPSLNKGQVLVRNHYSVISPGTEGKTVSDARKGYIAKAKSRQKEVKQVINMIKTNGLLSTYKLVMNKLEAYSPLGYSTSGEVIAIGEGVTQYKIGDRVACGGGTAFHADVVAVPENLCCKIPLGVELEEASFATIASIAIQGIRQSELNTGENCAIIGMGLIGQLTAKILDASNILPIGIDISEKQVMKSKNAGIKNVYHREQAGLYDKIMDLTNGYGVDSVIITAGTSSLDPIEFAGEISRKKGKVVIVGAVPTGFSRKNYYQKELDLRMSSSYGPGRYDANYEEKGIDYPIAYVRFTEQRNMLTYLNMLADKKIDIKPLITHKFKFEDSSSAYSMIVNKSTEFTGIVIDYDESADIKRDIVLDDKSTIALEPNIGMIGAGNFAQNILLPKMKGLCNFISIATMQGNESLYVAKKYGFKQALSSAEEVISDERVNTVFILTRHNTHADFVIKAIQAGKHVYTEKPLAMNEDELENIKSLKVNTENINVMVGFNRRFSPAIKRIKEILLNDQPKTINIRVNAGVMPPDHWVNDPEIGGGRIIGEVCHFIDLAMFLAGSDIENLSAISMKENHNLTNTLTINLRFKNGSIASVSYFSNGNNNLEKEFIEVFSGGTVMQIDDFNTLTIYNDSKRQRLIKYKSQDKGHAQEMIEFMGSIKENTPIPIPFRESYMSTKATFKVIESIKTGRSIKFDDYE